MDTIRVASSLIDNVAQSYFGEDRGFLSMSINLKKGLQFTTTSVRDFEHRVEFWIQNCNECGKQAFLG